MLDPTPENNGDELSCCASNCENNLEWEVLNADKRGNCASCKQLLTFGGGCFVCHMEHMVCQRCVAKV